MIPTPTLTVLFMFNSAVYERDFIVDDRHGACFEVNLR